MNWFKLSCLCGLAAVFPNAAAVGAAETPEPAYVDLGGKGNRLVLSAPSADFSSHLYLKGWTTCSTRSEYLKGEKFELNPAADRVGVTFRANAVGSAEIEQYYLSTELDLVSYVGGRLIADGREIPFPAKCGGARVASVKANRLSLVNVGGECLDFAFDRPVEVFLQDNRVFGMQTFDLRFGLARGKLIAGTEHVLAFSLSSGRGVRVGKPAPVVITANDEWTSFHATTDIEPGSALDFSQLCGPIVPCGTHGRVIAVGDHFEFEKMPGVAQRFYGANLCFTANFLKLGEARKLVANLRRIGYNSIRIHHHDGGLVQGMPDSTTLNPDQLDRLDALLAACSEAGMYVTTDLYVSRRVRHREIGVDKAGWMAEMPVKTAIREDPKMRENFKRFVRNWLTHVNPYTKRRWADEPALAWLSLINEGNPGNPSCGRHDRATLAAQLALDRDLKAFLRDEIGCKALITSMNGWSNVPGTMLPRAEVYDFVDDHYYFDHPVYLDSNWSTPSRCSNVLPFADSRLEHFSWRLFGKPFVISEFNYVYPSKMRGAGGLVMGALSGTQDWSALWRFAWGQSAELIRDCNAPGAKFFDVCSDPTGLASERAAMALFLRRDIEPHARRSAVRYSREFLNTDAAYKGANEFCGDLPWYDQIGHVVGAVPRNTRIVLNDGETRVAERNLVASRSQKGAPLAVDADRGTFAVDTPRTKGAFVREGSVELPGFSVRVKESFATVWAMSLDGAPLERAKRMLVTHLTETVKTGASFTDRSRTVMTDFGAAPHLMRNGRALVSIKVSPGRYRVYALAQNGARLAEVRSEMKGGFLRFIANVRAVPDSATCLYEIEGE